MGDPSSGRRRDRRKRRALWDPTEIKTSQSSPLPDELAESDSKHGSRDCPECALVIERLENEPLNKENPFEFWGPNGPLYLLITTIISPMVVCEECKGILSGKSSLHLGHNLERFHQSPSAFPLKRGLGCALCVLFLRERCRRRRENLPLLSAAPILTVSRPHYVLVCSEDGQQVKRAYQESWERYKKRIRIVPRSELHWPLIRSWLKDCEGQHGSECNQTLLQRGQSETESLTLIDVHEQRLVERDYSCRYVTLSYVWGGVS